MKKTLGLFIATLFVAGAASAAELKVGFVDVRKAVEATKAGQKAKKDLEADFKKREKELQKLADDVKKMNADYEKKSLVLSDEAKLKKQQEIQEGMTKYNLEVKKNTDDLRKKEQELMEPILQKMQEVISRIAEKEGYSLIIQNREIIAYASKDSDITDKVVKEFEKK